MFGEANNLSYHQSAAHELELKLDAFDDVRSIRVVDLIELLE